jgi:hypothetical protein
MAHEITLTNLWKDYNVSNNKVQNYVCFNDVVGNIIKSKNIKQYIYNNIKGNDKIKINNEVHVHDEFALRLIRKSRSDIAKKFVQDFDRINQSNHIDQIGQSNQTKQLNQVDQSNQSNQLNKSNQDVQSNQSNYTAENNYCNRMDTAKIINMIVKLYNHICNCNNYDECNCCDEYDECKIIHHKDEIWYKAKDVCSILGYKCLSPIIKNHLQLHDVKIFMDFDDNIKKHHKGIQSQTIFINKNGLKILLIKSRKYVTRRICSQLKINLSDKMSYKEMCIFDELDNFLTELNIDFIVHYKIPNTTFIVDMFLPSHNIIIEVDEDNHLNYDKNNEQIRQKIIERKMNVEFVRINPDDPNFNMSKMLAQLAKKLQW